MAEQLVAVGLMSGTSADGVDAALVVTDGKRDFAFVDALSAPYGGELQKQLIGAGQVGEGVDSFHQILELESQVTCCHAEAVSQILDRNPEYADRVSVIGFHGHTVRHQPQRGHTWQIGDASYLSEQTQIPVVSDFRRRDMAAGGQGAPLAALFHAMLFHDHPAPIAVLNLGGVANLTWIDEQRQVHAGDTGPGCGLLDALVQEKTGHPFDRDGVLSAAGKVHPEIVERAFALPFFQLPFPRSADRYDFDSVDVAGLSLEDAAATLCHFTARAVGESASRLGSSSTLWMTGGGSQNPVLVKMLGEYFPRVRNVREVDLRSDSLEAECFAWLAVRRLRGLPTSVPTTTGCRQPTCGGLLTAALI